jgi:phosphate transport system permease protein
MSTEAAAPRTTFPSGELFEWKAGEIARAPSGRQMMVDRVFRAICFGFTALTIGLVAFIVLRIACQATPAVQRLGFGFLSGRVWDPNTERYGILGEIWGTLYTSVLAVLLGTAFGLAAAIFMSEGYLGEPFQLLRRIDLHLHPGDACRIRPSACSRISSSCSQRFKRLRPGACSWSFRREAVCSWLHLKLGWIDFQHGRAVPACPRRHRAVDHILPTITAISRDALVSVPGKLRMAAYGLGATRWETVLAVILPTAQRGIFGGVILAFGRALGETMALAMLVGNANQISLSLFSPANTLAALLANNFPEAGVKQVSVLMYAALILLAITLAVNIAGAVVIQRATREHAD